MTTAASAVDRDEREPRWKWAEMLALPRTSPSSASWSVPTPTTTNAPMSRSAGQARRRRAPRAVHTAHSIRSGSALHGDGDPVGPPARGHDEVRTGAEHVHGDLL